MKKIEIQGGRILEGTICVSGAKNSAVALVPASLLCRSEERRVGRVSAVV